MRSFTEAVLTIDECYLLFDVMSKGMMSSDKTKNAVLKRVTRKGFNLIGLNGKPVMRKPFYATGMGKVEIPEGQKTFLFKIVGNLSIRKAKGYLMTGEEEYLDCR